jgi:hypothetical protein
MKTNKLLLSVALGAASLMAATTASACALTAWSATAGTPVANQPNQSPSVGRYSGLCAMQADAIGDFVTDNTPANEASYNVRFYVFTGTHTGGAADIFQARNTGGTNIIRVQNSGTQLTFGMNGTATTRTASVVANRWYSVELAWEASATGSLNITLFDESNGNQVAVTPITGVNNSSDRIDDARLGKIAGAGTGFMNFDAFDSRRTTSPGRLCRGDSNNSSTVTGADATQAILEFVNGTLAQGQPDVNGNGNVTGGDATGIINVFIANGGACG